MKTAVFAGLVLLGMAGNAQSQSIERACLGSDRDAANRALCSCIQQAADMTLNARDQRLASTFYRDPQKAQDIRQSGRSAHARFWERYKDYAEIARTFCG